jgi:pilus assembly protein CpaE
MLSVPLILVGVGDKLTKTLKDELALQAADVEASFRSANTAIEGLKKTRSEPRLIFVSVETAPDLKQIRQLAETLRGWPIVALVGTHNQPEMLLQANRAGANQVVPLPIQSADLHAALSCVAIQNRPVAKDCSVIAFSSSAAGCGTTSLATNFAYQNATQRKQRTILIEMAQQMGVIATNLDVVPACTLVDLLADPDQLDGELVQRSLVKIAENFELLAGNQGVTHHDEFAFKDVLRILDYVRPLAEVVVLDVPCTYTEFQFEILGMADQVVLVGEQSIASIRSLKLMLDALSHGANSANIHIVINRYDSAMEGLAVANLMKTLGTQRVQTIPDDRPSVLAAANEGKLLRQAAPQSPVAAGIDHLVASLLGGQEQPIKPYGSNIFSRIFHAFAK